MAARGLAGSSTCRTAGAAALDLCDVACGRFDGFWEEGLKAWDVAAGILLARPFPLRMGDAQEVTPVSLWEDTFIQDQPLPDDGPVSVEVGYRIRAGEAQEFLQGIRQLCPVRDLDLHTHDVGVALQVRYGFSVYPIITKAAGARRTALRDARLGRQAGRPGQEIDRTTNGIAAIQRRRTTPNDLYRLYRIEIDEVTVGAGQTANAEIIRDTNAIHLNQHPVAGEAADCEITQPKTAGVLPHRNAGQVADH